MVTAIAPGDANLTITYTTPPGASTSARVSVTVPVPIVVLPASSSLYVSQSVPFAVTLALRPELDESVTWSISPRVGGIDQSGLYTAPASIASRQKVTVTATSVADSTKFASAQVWILPLPKKR